MINRDDFHYMWRGKPTGPLPESEVERLKPIYIYKKKHGRALLLLHGFSSSPAVYRSMIPTLTHYDALVCPALPGHAENIAAFASVNSNEWITAAETACESLLEHYDTVEVVGLSLGGLLAYHLAQKYPVKHLYLLAPAFKPTFNLKLVRTLARVFHALGLKHIKNRAGNLYTKTHDELSYRKLPTRNIVEVLNFIENREFTALTCPIDLFLGRYDEVIDSPYLAKTFEDNPNCNTHWLEHSAHVLPLDGDMKTIIDCINSPL